MQCGYGLDHARFDEFPERRFGDTDVAAYTGEPDATFSNKPVGEAWTAAQDGCYLLAFEQTIIGRTHV
jgi:hypothetical protein